MDYPPFEFVDSEGKPDGYDVDLIRAVASVMNLDIRIQPSVWDVAKRGLEEGRVDILTGMLQSPERDRFADFTKPHLKIHYSIFIRKGAAAPERLDDLRRMKVVVGNATLVHEFLLSNGFSDQILTVPTEPDALRRLAAGEADVALLPLLQGLLAAKKSKLDNVVAVGAPILEKEACLAVREGNHALRAQLDTGLAILHQTGEYDRIYEKWFGSLKEEQLTLAQILRLLAYVVIPVCLLALAILLWNRSLRRQVEGRTRELRKAVEDLHRSESFLNRVLDRIPLILFAKDPEREFRYSIWNKTAEDLMGISRTEVIGRTMGELYPAELAERIGTQDLGILKKRTEVEILEETFPTRHRGNRLMRTHRVPVLDDDGRPITLLGIAEDITDVRKAEEALKQTQRLESLGVLAGGIAHDFNNVLTAVMGNLNLAQMRCEDRPDILKYLKNMETAVVRAAALSRQMLAYSGRGVFVIRVVDINRLIQDISHLIDVSIPPKIRRAFVPGVGIPHVRADESQLQQVILNLITNASEAIGDREGEIRIESRCAQFDAEEVKARFPRQELVPGLYVLVSVRDTGCGIPPENLERLFEPFFTTKVTGRGLGLAALQGIVKGHHGGLRIESEVGKGTLFEVCFPAWDGPVGVSDPTVAVAPAGNGRLVLVADDEEMVREMTGALLRKMGYEAVEAPDGQSALDAFSRRPNEFALVILDLTMPRLNGWETLDGIRKLNPGVKAVLTSGYHEHEAMDGRTDLQVDGFLPKPFQFSELKQLLGGLFPASEKKVTP